MVHRFSVWHVPNTPAPYFVINPAVNNVYSIDNRDMRPIGAIATTGNFYVSAWELNNSSGWFGVFNIAIENNCRSVVGVNNSCSGHGGLQGVMGG
jgi:hypothetical protein